jgi:deazaflavin-dependent oxidoreductase (nitroreductase family)
VGYLDVADRIWPLLSRVMGAHTFAYRRTGGRIGHRLPFLPQMLLLDHVGARSGVERTSPLVYARDGDDLILIASKGGFPKNPAWYYNLKANPDTTVQVGSEVLKVHARQANADERPRLWQKATTIYPGFDQYQERTDRQIPVMVLEPRGARS